MVHQKTSKRRERVSMSLKNELYKILDELYTAAQELKDFCYVLERLRESFPVTGAAETKAIVTCCKTYVSTVECQITEQLDSFDEILTGL